MIESLHWRRQRRWIRQQQHRQNRISSRLGMPRGALRASASQAVASQNLGAAMLPVESVRRPLNASCELAGASICTRDHLHLAGVLIESFFRHHREAQFWLLIVDGKEVDRHVHPRASVLLAEDLGCPEPYDFLKLTQAEVCHLAKPALVGALLDGGARKVVYLDSDQMIFSPLAAMLHPLDLADLAMVPHLCSPFPHAERDIDRPLLEDISKAGLMNAGLFAVRASPEGRRAMATWEEILRCPRAFAATRGAAHEQNAFNWLLAFLDNVHIVRDPTVNVAYWNLHELPERRRLG